MAIANRSTRNPLQTQKDGRLFAIALLKQLERQSASADRFCAYCIVPGDEDAAVRTKPQDPSLMLEFDKVMREGSKDAIAGFFCVMSHVLAHGPECWTFASSFEKYERHGALEDWRLAN